MLIYSITNLIDLLKCSDNNFWGVDISKNISFVPGDKVDLIPVVFLIKWLLGIRRAKKKLSEAINM